MASASVADLERDVEQRSAVFKGARALRSGFDPGVFVVGTIWVGWAAKLGSDQNVFWVLAMLSNFYQYRKQCYLFAKEAEK